MPTVLKDELVRETGLTKDGTPVYVSLIPDETGGRIAFRCKNQREYLVEIQLESLMNSLPSSSSDDITECPHGVVNLADLTTYLMIQDPEFMDLTVKSKLWRLIRNMQNELNANAGLPTVDLAMKVN